MDHLAVLLALRGRALTLSVAATGSTTLAATTTGYTRAAGSFVTDGFAVGMEVTPSGFAETTPAVITSLSATAIGIEGGRTAESSGAGRSLTVGLPAFRSWENTDLIPTTERWYVDEDYLPGPAAQVTLGAFGEIEAEPMYVLKVYGPAGTGASALYKVSDAILALFAPRTAMTISTGDVLRVRTNPAPFRGQILPAPPGRAVAVITIPCRMRTANSI